MRAAPACRYFDYRRPASAARFSFSAINIKMLLMMALLAFAVLIVPECCPAVTDTGFDNRLNRLMKRPAFV